MKALYDRPTDNIILKEEKLKALLIRSGRTQEYPLTSLLFNIVPEVLVRPFREEKESSFFFIQ